MKKIKLMADYQCDPLWADAPDEFGNVSPDSLPISPTLKDALTAWAEKFDSTLDLDDHTKIGFSSQDEADQFVTEGNALLKRLQMELGPEYIVSGHIVAYPRSR